MKSKKLKLRIMTLILAGIMAFVATAFESADNDINRDGTLIFGGWGWDYNFNPLLSANAPDSNINTLVFEGLLSGNEQGEIPLIATHWERCEDNLTYTFYMDERAAFSNGRPLTAHDVYFTFTTAAHPDYIGPRTNVVASLEGFEEFNSGEADSLSGINIIDDHTIQFTHTIASPRNIMNFSLGILCAEHYAWETWDDFLRLAGKPFGSGQFVFIDKVIDEWIEFERNENYWNCDWQINLAGITIYDLHFSDVITDSVLAGEVHMAQVNTNLENLRLFDAMQGITAVSFTSNSMLTLTFNTTRPHLSDHRVRQALVYAFDTRAAIVTDAGSPRLRAIGVAPFSPVSWAFPPAGTLNNYDFNMQRAAQLMDEAGWTMGASGYRYNADGERFSLHFLAYHNQLWVYTLVDQVWDSWSELGVELDMEWMDFNQMLDRVIGTPPEDRVFDVFPVGWQLSSDPDMADSKWDFNAHRAGGFNSSGWYNTRFQELIELARTTFDQEERVAYYHELAAMTNYYLPVWVISTGVHLWAVDSNVQNLEFGAFMHPFLAITQQGTWIDE